MRVNGDSAIPRSAYEKEAVTLSTVLSYSGGLQTEGGHPPGHGSDKHPVWVTQNPRFLTPPRNKLSCSSYCISDWSKINVSV